MFIQRVTRVLGFLGCAALVAAGSKAEDSATEKAAAEEKSVSSAVCSREHAGLKFCISRGGIVREGNKYVATLSVQLESTTPGAAYNAMLPYGGGAELDADGVSGWRLDHVQGLKVCNSTSEAGCAKVEAYYTTITPGSRITYRLWKAADEHAGAALADVKTASLTFRLLIGPEGGVVRPQGFAVSDFPVRVVRP